MPYPFRILLILIFFVFKLDAEVVSAQIPVVDGFLVTNDRDTIRGKFEYVSKSLFENRLVFIKGARTAISVFRPAEIRGLFSSGIAFESKKVEGERMFLRALSRGRVNLYSDGKGLFISDSSIMAVELKGGEKPVVINGKNYVQEFNNYKSQLQAYVKDPTFNSRIANMYYDQNEIMRFVREVNNDNSDLVKPHVYNRSYFAFEAGVSVSSMERRMTDDDFDMRSQDWDYDIKRHLVRSWVAGLTFKLKMLKTRSHIGAGLQYEHTPLTVVEDRRLFNTGAPFISPSDTIVEVVDRYAYKFSSVNFGFGFYPEVSNGRFRPFFDVGLAGKIYLMNEASSNRTRYENGVMMEQSEKAWMTPGFLIGPKGGGGCRFIIDMDRSLSAGFTAELYGSSKVEMDIVRIFAKRIYLVYAF